MGAPTDIMQEAGRADQAAALGLGRFKERQDKMINHLAKTGQARIFLFGEPTGFDQGVTVAQHLRHSF